VTIYSLEEDKRDDVLDGVDHAMLESIIRSLKIKYFDPQSADLKASHRLLLNGLDPHKVRAWDDDTRAQCMFTPCSIVVFLHIGIWATYSIAQSSQVSCEIT
jgi:hypothetical protein